MQLRWGRAEKTHDGKASGRIFAVRNSLFIERTRDTMLRAEEQLELQARHSTRSLMQQHVDGAAALLIDAGLIGK